MCRSRAITRQIQRPRHRSRQVGLMETRLKRLLTFVLGAQVSKG